MPLAVTVASAALFVAVEIAFFVGYLRRRKTQPWSGVPGKTHEGFELAWALGPAIFLAILLAMTLQGLVLSTVSRVSDVALFVAGQGFGR